MRIEVLYKFFLYSPASHLPVWEEGTGLLGLLPKERVLMELADLSAAEREFERIPEEFLIREIPETVLAFFQKQRTIPVLGPLGEKLEDWDKPRFLSELSRSSWMAKETEKPKTSPQKTEEEKAKQSQWFMEVLLQNFPDGLIATDLDGHTVFYNETFEKDILVKKWFRDSILQAEKLLKEMSKDLLGNYLKTHELRLEEGRLSVQTFIPDLDCIVRVSILKQKGKPLGYLYHFSPASAKLNSQDGEGMEFPSVTEAFNQKLPLETMLKEVEGSYIYHTLKRNQENVSHAALDLGVPRTTLQNRIKFLDLTSKFKLNKDQPIPRKKTGKQSSPKKTVPQANKPAVVETKPKPASKKKQVSSKKKSTSKKRTKQK
ncbi:transcriptional regulator [Leptospira koniambonensis]|uniref:Transcriptional regulator n=1 Tax=Leptospira koniambonensis TaxID=2484950 RepID=A0A4R9J984_9LEPT|nr:PAS domain-containing protein [Leptospira koniambonensis]TGL35427.1 transcriptional regulator [Leptospira koniambonensis]